MNRKGLKFILFAAVLSFMLKGNMISATAATATCESYTGSNISMQDYGYWADTVKSYFVPISSDRIMEVQWVNSINSLFVKYYDSNFNVVSTKLVAAELPLFGGFYEYNGYFYVCSGNLNDCESNAKEVYRVTKYTSSWTRVSSASVYGANTTVPFDAGSCRMTGIGDHLIVRTCHEMYMTSDGYNHQANVTIDINVSNMSVVDAKTSISNIGTGYVSHSFNQFVLTDGNGYVAIDHGDAHPRSLVLTKYSSLSNGTYACSASMDLLSFAGAVGDNYTGASVGGFEMSDSAYIAAGNSVVQDGRDYYTRNIFVATANRSAINNRSVKWITNYPEGSEGASTPQLVKLSGNSFMLLWNRSDKVYYTLLDASGNTVGSIKSMNGYLSDCKPVLFNGNVVWYTWANDQTDFYQINASTLTAKVTNVTNGHKYSASTLKISGGVATFTCPACKKTVKYRVPTSMRTWFKDKYTLKYSDSYWSFYGGDYHPGDTVEVWNTNFEYASSDSTIPTRDDIEIISSNPSICRVELLDNFCIGIKNKITFLKEGNATITIRLKYNPSVSTTMNVSSKHDYVRTAYVASTCTKEGYEDFKCSSCGSKKRTVVKKVAHKTQETITPATTSANGKIVYTCKTCKATVKDPTVIYKPSKIKFEKSSYSYTGKVISPSLKVYDSKGKAIPASEYTVSYSSGRKNVGTYKATVTFKGKKYAGKKSASFDINPKKTELVSLTGKSKALVVKWKKQTKQVSGYEIQYSTKSDFSSAKTSKVKSASTVTKTVKSLKGKCKYYVRIRTYYTKGSKTYYSKWSAAKNIKTK